MLESYEDPDVPFFWFHSFREFWVGKLLCLAEATHCSCLVDILLHLSALQMLLNIASNLDISSVRLSLLCLQFCLIEWAIPGLGMFCEVLP